MCRNSKENILPSGGGRLLHPMLLVLQTRPFGFLVRKLFSFSLELFRHFQNAWCYEISHVWLIHLSLCLSLSGPFLHEDTFLLRPGNCLVPVLHSGCRIHCLDWSLSLPGFFDFIFQLFYGKFYCWHCMLSVFFLSDSIFMLFSGSTGVPSSQVYWRCTLETFQNILPS